MTKACEKELLTSGSIHSATSGEELKKKQKTWTRELENIILLYLKFKKINVVKGIFKIARTWNLEVATMANDTEMLKNTEGGKLQ